MRVGTDRRYHPVPPRALGAVPVAAVVGPGQQVRREEDVVPVAPAVPVEGDVVLRRPSDAKAGTAIRATPQEAEGVLEDGAHCGGEDRGRRRCGRLAGRPSVIVVFAVAKIQSYRRCQPIRAEMQEGRVGGRNEGGATTAPRRQSFHQLRRRLGA